MGAKTFEAIAAGQGWNEESRLIHALGFIQASGKLEEFVAYAERAAQEENQCVGCGGCECTPSGCLECCRDCGRPCGFEKDGEGFHAD